MKFKRTKCNCKECPLDGRDKVYGQGSFGGKIAFVGEAPGEVEDLCGIPFSGKSGAFFNAMLGMAEIYRSSTWLTNVVLCRPPENRISSLEGMKAVECCLPGFREELSFLRKEGIRGVGTLGATSKEALGVEGKLTQVRGSTYEKDGFYVTPIFHPAYLLRLGYNRNGGKVDQKIVFVGDLKKVKASTREGYTLPKEKFIYSPTLKDIEDFFVTAHKEEQDLALDLETYGGMNPRLGTEILCMGIARDTENAIIIPFVQQHKMPYWNGKLHEMKNLLRFWLPKFKLIIQNALYDIPIMHHTGLLPYDILWPLLKHDTMVLHHCINPDLPHNLGFITSTYGDTPYWKDTLKEKKCPTYELPNEEIWQYNGKDCVVMHQITPPMLEDLRLMNNESTYYDEELPMLPYIMQMMDNGILYDPKKGRALKKKWEKEQKGHYEELLKYGLPLDFNLDSDDQMRWLFWGSPLTGFSKLNNLLLYKMVPQFYLKCSSCKKYTWVSELEVSCPKCNSYDFSIGKTKEGEEKRREYYPREPDTQVHKDLLVLKEVYEMEIPILRKPLASIRQTDGGKMKVDSKARLQQVRGINNRLNQMKSFKHQEGFAEEKGLLERTITFYTVFQKYTELSKLISTYTDYKTEPDGRVHGRILVTGTGTGRLAMREPNLMNLPKKRMEARTPFVVPPGRVMLSPDYTNLEVYVLAYESGDVVLQKFLRDGGNVHDRNTILILEVLGEGDLTDKNPRWKPVRRVAKIIQFGSIQYGGKDNEIYENVLSECPDLGLTYKDFQVMVKALKEGNVYYKNWSEGVRKVAREERFSKTFLGRIRQLMGMEADLEKQGLNTPIQGGAAGIMNRSFILVGKEQDDYKQDKLLLQVHDQILLETNDNLKDIERCNEYLIRNMQQNFFFDDEVVSFPAEMDIGYSFGELEPYEKFMKRRRK